MPKKVSVPIRLAIEEKIGDSPQKYRNLRKVIFSKVENIAWWGVAIVYFSGFWCQVFYGIETISRKNHRIILAQKLGPKAKSVFQYFMSDPFHKYGLPERNHLALKSQCSRIETPLREKSSHQIRTEDLRHEGHESLPSATIEKGIMKNCNLTRTPLQRSCRRHRRRLRILLWIILLWFPSWGVREAGDGWFLFFFLFHRKRILNNL